MATVATRKIEYPTSDGRPVAETDWHCDNIFNLRGTLDDRYAADPMVYVAATYFCSMCREIGVGVSRLIFLSSKGWLSEEAKLSPLGRGKSAECRVRDYLGINPGRGH